MGFLTQERTCLTSMIIPVWFSTIYLLFTVTTCASFELR